MPPNGLNVRADDRLLKGRGRQRESGRGRARSGQHRRAGESGDRAAGENAKDHGFLQVSEPTLIMV
jgi:hypothetical protein